MNAYELADKLEWHWDNDCRSPAISKSIDMLRQQADRIADYERWEKRWSERVARAENRIAELEKELYFKNYYEELPDTPVGIIGKIGDSPIHDLVHKTTPQIKELSDEEIDSLIAEYKIGEFSGFYVDKAMTESMQRRYKNALDFARAILKKSSEK